MSTHSPPYLHAISTHPPPSYKVEDGWTKGGGGVENGWRLPPLYGSFMPVLEPVSGNV